MAERVELKIMKCPSCGAKLKIERPNEPIPCVYCGNTIIPTVGAPATEKEATPSLTTVRIEGIKTSASALAYLEQYFEEFDWEAFVFSQALEIPEIKKMSNSLRVTSADDKNTWLVCFEALYMPIFKKIEGCSELLSAIIKEYIADNFDAYSKFDAYKRIALSVKNASDDVDSRLTKYLAYAEKYGASAEELADMREKLGNFRSLSQITVYASIDDIPKIKQLLDEKNEKLIAELAQEGINAPDAYNAAKNLINQKNYVGALNILNQLRGYSDSKKLAEEIDRYFLIEDILEIKGELFYFKQNPEQPGKLELYPTQNGIIGHTPIIRDIGKIVTNYADIIYYLDPSNKMKRFDIGTMTASKSDDRIYNKDHMYAYKKRNSVLMLSRRPGSGSLFELVELDPATGAIKSVASNIRKIISVEDNRLAYLEGPAPAAPVQSGGCLSKNETPAPAPTGPQFTNILDLDTMFITRLGNTPLNIEGYVNDSVVYTRLAPNDMNKNLYIRKMNEQNSPEILVESNIMDFMKIVSGKLFYYIGNKRNRTLITINPDGSGRGELPSFISEILFEQNGWIYFIRRVGYNSVLCKAKTDSSELCIIASDIDRFVGIKNGYLYYINDINTLIKIRMDGTNLSELCTQVENVLSIKENRIVFVSVDDTVTEGGLVPVTTRVKSIYAVDFDGTGKRKLTYNIKTAKFYNDEYVYFIASKRINRPATAETAPASLDSLYRLNIINDSIEKLLEVSQAVKAPEKNYINIAIAVAVIFFIIAFIGFAAENIFIALFSALITLAAAGYIAYEKLIKKE